MDHRFARFRRRSNCLAIVAACCWLAIHASLARAGDWPQILGPDRNGKARDEQLAESWPADGPKMRWQLPVGRGLAGVAVVDGRVVLFHRMENELVAAAIDAKTGKPLWEKRFPTAYRSGISPDDGPRCVPVVHEGQVYLFGPEGDLHCLSLAKGTERWSRSLYHDYDAQEGYFGAGSSPLVESGKVLVNVGGRSGAGLVALSPDTGKTLWQGTDEQASYSSPVAATIDGVRHAIFVTRLNVVSVDPADGAVRFRFPFGQRGPTVNAANPLVIDGHLFVTANYGIGARWAKIGKQAAEIVWDNDETMSSQFSTSIEHGGYLYGIDGRQDVGVGRLRAVDPRTGKVAWTEEGFGMATLILADEKLLVMKIDGELILVRPSPEKYQQLVSAKLFNTTVQALPALSQGLLYVRDTKTLKCLEVGRSKTSK